MKTIVVGLGEVLWDVYPDGRYLGGAVANAAVHAHRLGLNGIVASAVGEDELGDEIIQALEDQGMDTSAMQRCSTKPTGTVGVTLDKNGIPSYRCSMDTAFDYIRWDATLERLSKEADAVVVGTFDQRNAVAMETTQRFLKEAEGMLKVFDVNFRSWDENMERIVFDTFEHADIVKLNVDEYLKLQKAMRQDSMGMLPFLDGLVDRWDLRMAAVSLGDRGCLVTDGEEHVLSPGIVVNVEDTTGCGDAFVAALAVKFLEEASLDETAEFANGLGAFIATMKSAVPAYTLEDFEHFRETHQQRKGLSIQ